MTAYELYNEGISVGRTARLPSLAGRTRITSLL